MDLYKQEELLIAVALTRFSVEFEASHPAVAEHAEQISIRLLSHHDLTPEEVTAAVLDSN